MRCSGALLFIALQVVPRSYHSTHSLPSGTAFSLSELSLTIHFVRPLPRLEKKIQTISTSLIGLPQLEKSLIRIANVGQPRARNQANS